VEKIGVILTVAVLILTPVGMIAADRHFASGEPADVTFTLTGVSDGGVWTEEAVVGHNYWRRTPKPARLVARAGQKVRIRLQSADVTHGFSIPDLDVGPILIEPGHVVEAVFTPEEPGEYLFQCTTRCGKCHEEMLGSLVVLGEGETLENYPGGLIKPRTKCLLHGRS